MLDNSPKFNPFPPTSESCPFLFPENRERKNSYNISPYYACVLDCSRSKGEETVYFEFDLHDIIKLEEINNALVA